MNKKANLKGENYSQEHIDAKADIIRHNALRTHLTRYTVKVNT